MVGTLKKHLRVVVLGIVGIASLASVAVVIVQAGNDENTVFVSPDQPQQMAPTSILPGGEGYRADGAEFELITPSPGDPQ